MLNFTNIIKSIGLLLLLTLTACSTVPLSSTTRVPLDQLVFSSLPSTLSNNIALSDQEENPFYIQLLKANSEMTAGNLDSAQAILENLSIPQEDIRLNNEKTIITARLELKKGYPLLARKRIYSIATLNALPLEMQVTYYRVLEEIEQRTDHLAYSILAEIRLNELLIDHPLSDDIWQQLQKLSLTSLKTFSQNVNNSIIRGWLSLAILSKENANDTAALFLALSTWSNQYPEHPAQKFLPQDKAFLNPMNSSLTSQWPKQVALLLPLEGAYKEMGQAIRDGFMTAYYQEHNFNSSNRKALFNVKVYDTSQTTDIEMLYQQAIDEGAQWVIGPLIKEEVNRLAQSSLPVPTLFLNYLSSHFHASDSNQFQFGVSTESAAQQAADMAWEKGCARLALIVPDNPWGQTIEEAFTHRWSDLGGSLIDVFRFSSGQDLGEGIKALLRVDQSLERAQNLETVLEEKLKTVPRRRQDIDGLFLASLPQEAHQIIPLLRFYYAIGLNLFSIASIYPGYSEAPVDHDLNGVYFNDMPWALLVNAQTNLLKQQITSLWSSNYRRNAALYAVGIDSYHLISWLPRLQILPQFPFAGETGYLTLDENHVINQRLVPAQFVEGKPRVLKEE